MCSKDTAHVGHEMYGYTVITGATGTVTAGLKKIFEVVPGKQETFNRFTATSAVLGTSHIQQNGKGCSLKLEA